MSYERAWPHVCARRPTASRRPAARVRSWDTCRRSSTTSSMLQGVLEHLGEPWCERADDGAWWDEGRAVSLSATLPGGGRAHLVHHHLPGRERLSRARHGSLPRPRTGADVSVALSAARAHPAGRVPLRGCDRVAHDRAPRLLRGGVPRAVARVRRGLRGPRAGRRRRWRRGARTSGSCSTATGWRLRGLGRSRVRLVVGSGCSRAQVARGLGLLGLLAGFAPVDACSQRFVHQQGAGGVGDLVFYRDVVGVKVPA